MTPKSGKKRKIPTKSPRKGHPKTEEDGDDDEKVFKKKNQLKAEDVDDEDAQLMSGLLGFDVKKKLQEREKRTKREDDKNEACWSQHMPIPYLTHHYTAHNINSYRASDVEIVDMVPWRRILIS